MKRKILAAVSALLFLGIGALVTVNARDYLEVRRISRLPVSVPQSVWKRLAESYAPPSDNSRELLSGEQIPTEFRFLQPRRMTRSRHMLDICLWSENDADISRYAYIWLEVAADGKKRKIHLFHNFEGDQKRFVLWSSAPSPDSLFPESDRICSISASSMDGSSKWIVSPKKLARITYGLCEGSTDEVVFETDVDEGFRRNLEQGLASLPESALDKAYRAAGVCDGFTLTLDFSQPGERRLRRIAFDNEWLAAMDPIVAVVNSKCPQAHRIPSDFGEEVKRCKFDLRLVIEPIDEHSGALPDPILDWWIVWPRIFRVR